MTIRGGPFDGVAGGGRARGGAVASPLEDDASGDGAPVGRRDTAPGAQGAAAGVVLALLVVGAAVLAVVDRPPPPPPPPALDATLRLVGNALSNSQSGVLVLPVELVNRGPDVELERTVLWAEPVRQDPAYSGVTKVEAGGTGRFAVLLQPDCALLGPGQGMRVAATVVVSLRGPERQALDVRLDLGREPALALRILSLCQRGV